MPRPPNRTAYARQLLDALLLEQEANWSVTTEGNQIVVRLEQGPRGIKLQLGPEHLVRGSPEIWGRKLAHRLMAVMNGDMSNVTEVKETNA